MDFEFPMEESHQKIYTIATNSYLSLTKSIGEVCNGKKITDEELINTLKEVAQNMLDIQKVIILNDGDIRTREIIESRIEDRCDALSSVTTKRGR